MRIRKKARSPGSSREEIERFIVSAVARACRCNPDAVTGATRLIDLGVDSLTLTGIYALCEMTYGRFDEDEESRMLQAIHVGDIVTIVSQSVSKDGQLAG